MQSELKKEQRLVPLRRFAREDLYSSAYLSLLVQRGKLQAKRIGRNFFTTEAWFKEYLEKHAKDEIREAYEVVFKTSQSAKRKTQKHKLKLKTNTDSNSTILSSGFFNLGKVFSARNIALVLAFLVILLLVSQFKLMQDKGRVAGEEEVKMKNASSSEDSMIDYSSVKSEK